MAALAPVRDEDCDALRFDAAAFVAPEAALGGTGARVGAGARGGMDEDEGIDDCGWLVLFSIIWIRF